jgi:MFS family permease
LENYFRQLQPFLIHGIAVTAGVVFHFAAVRLLGVKEAGVFFSSFAMYSVFLMLSLFGQQKGLISSLYFKNGGNFGFVLKNIFLGWFTAVLFWQALVPNVPDVFVFTALLSAVVASLGVYYQYLRRFFIGSVFQQYGVRIGALLLIALAGSNSSVGLSYALLVSAAIFVSIGFLFLPRPRGGSVTPLTMGNLSHRSLLPYWAISVLTTLSDAAPIYLAAVISEPEFAAILAIAIKVAALGSFALVAVNKFSIVSYAARPQDRVFLQKKSARYWIWRLPRCHTDIFDAFLLCRVDSRIF